MCMQLIEKIDKLLTFNNGRISEREVCQVFNITPYDIPWGNHGYWYRSFLSNQTYDLIQIKKGN